MLLLALAAAPVAGQVLDLPSGFNPVAWSYSPAEAVRAPGDQRAVVWLGQVESVTSKAEGGKVVVEWLCRHLEFASPGPDAISATPVRFRNATSGYFVVNIVLEAPAETAASLRDQFEEAGRYILAAGRAAGVVRSGGRTAAFLETVSMTQADDLGEAVGE